MKAGRIRLNEISDNKSRLDSSYHLSEAQVIKHKIASSPFPLTTIGEVSKRIWHAGRWKRVYVDNHKTGIPLLGSSSMLKGDLSNEKLVSRKYTEDIPDKILQSGWILISCSGTIGNCAFTNAQHAGKLASQDVIRINPNNILGAGFIYAYLASKYGYVMLTQGTAGSVIQHIEPEHVESIPIPLFPEEFQKKVDSMIQESARLREEAADESAKVVDYFNNQLQISEEKNLCKRISIKEIQSSQNRRFEANYFCSRGDSYHQLIISQFEYEPLGNIFKEISRPDIFKRTYVNKGVGTMFLGCSELFMATPQSNKFISNRTQGIDSLKLNEGWILLPRSGTIGEVAYATSQHAQKLASEDVIRLKPDNILSGAYAFGFLSSIAGKSMLQKVVFGSVIQHIEPPLLKEIPVPIFKDQFNEIASLILGATKKLGRAGQLELDAIRMVEAEIEKWN